MAERVGDEMRLLANRTRVGCHADALTDGFAVLIQSLLALVAFSSLMLKRFREPVAVRRPWRIWCFDTSKQAMGALFIHFANVLLSTLTNEDPCSLYLINFILDATLGMLVIWAAVKVVSKIVDWRRLKLLKFGEYGEPPRAAAWLSQCFLYLLIMVLEKCVLSLVLLLPGWADVQEVLLRYIPNPQLELVLVMLIVPFCVNAIMFWVVDNLTMRKYQSASVSEGVCEVVQTEGPTPEKQEDSQVLLVADSNTDPEALEVQGEGFAPEASLSASGGSLRESQETP